MRHTNVSQYEDWNTRFYQERTVHHKPTVREDLLLYGPDSLTDLDLLIALLGTGTKDMPVEHLAQQALQVILTQNRQDWPEKLRQIKGLGDSKTAVILAAMECGGRYAASREIKIHKAADMHPLLQPYALEKQEHFVVVSLNGAHEIVDIHVVSVGSQNRTIVHPRDVFSHAVQTKASAIIVAHNHPSGNCEPSVEDYQLTERLILSAKAIGIQLLDHLIITKTGFFSFLEETSIFTKEILSTGELTRELTYTAAHDSPLVKNWLEEIQMST